MPTLPATYVPSAFRSEIVPRRTLGSGTRSRTLGSTADFAILDTPNLLRLYDAVTISTLFQDNLLTTPVTASGQATGAIVDQIIAANLLQGSSSLRSIYQATALNGGPCQAPDGSDDVLVSAAFAAIPQPFTVILCAQLNSTAGSQYLCDGATGARCGIGVTGGNWIIHGGTQVSTGIAANTSPHVLFATFAGASSTFQVDGGAPVTVSAGTNAPTAFRLFLRTDGLQPSSARIGLAMFVSGSPSASTISSIRDYCRTRWATP